MFVHSANLNGHHRLTGLNVISPYPLIIADDIEFHNATMVMGETTH
jgi:hypothetical protein